MKGGGGEEEDDKEEEAGGGGRRGGNSDMNKQDKILVPLVSSFCTYNIGNCRHLGTCCAENY